MKDVNKTREQCNQLLLAMLGRPALVEQWWKSQNYAFGMQTPGDIFENDSQRVFDYLMHHAYAGGGS